MNRQDIDFRQIAPRCGGQKEAFEELCCQLANRNHPGNQTFRRLLGAGGDGGVECFADLPDGNRIGWQAKYIFSIDSLLVQATKSLKTALLIHPTLTRYILCFPFDLTGPTRRLGKSGVEKFEAWRDKYVRKAADLGCTLEIEDWSAAKLRSLLFDFDVSGGIRTFFFEEAYLSPEWFAAHLQAARAMAGPRYTPELNVRTKVGKWLSALGRTKEWLYELDKWLAAARKKYNRLNNAIVRVSGDNIRQAWPDNLREEANSVSERMRESLDACGVLGESYSQETYRHIVESIEYIISSLSSLETKLAIDLEEKHGTGQADSAGFRQFMAEYHVSFPAANLDTVRETLEAFRNLCDWIESPEGGLAISDAFVLSGEWGAGKTHGVCDVACQRLEQDLLSCLVFGHQFDGAPDIWTRFAESLGLPTTIGKDGLLDALNAAAEASDKPLILFIDAINETNPRRYWRNHLGAVVDEIRKRPGLRICFTCRTPFLTICLPDAPKLTVKEHPGFKGIERIACTAFFKYYGLTPPVSPILQSEFGNPLYLKLMCETLKSLGMIILPVGWTSVAKVISAFLEVREKEFARDKETSPHARIVTASLRSIARAIAESGQSKLSWSDASRVVQERHPETSTLNIVNWLIGANLLIEDASDEAAGFDAEGTVRLSFERFGDFLIASELLTQLDQETSINSVFKPEGLLYEWVRNRSVVEENHGVLSALSILIPEQYPEKELSELGVSEEVHDVLREIVVASIPWRDPSTFSSATQDLLLEGLNKQNLYKIATDSLLSVAWRPSTIDATWFHSFLGWTSFAERDAFWCVYLYQSYEQSGPVKRLIDAAFDLPLDAIDIDVVDRWATVLLWFTAAADRRVKDFATRALIRVLVADPTVIPMLLNRFRYVDDDEVRERLLLASYGALIISRDTNIIPRVTSDLQTAFRDSPKDFDNAQIRDLVRCIGELAETHTVLPEGCDSELTLQPIGSKWPLELPTEDHVEEWSSLLHFKPNEFFSDFYKYSMNCLQPWMHAFRKEDMGKWILQRVIRDFNYKESGCERYDRYMLYKYGGGRGKPVWAERIGKKYLWIAMYQLASRLHDHVDQTRKSWEPEPLKTPLILLEERKLDPTLPMNLSKGESNTLWWLTASADFESTKHFSDDEWVAIDEDVPALDKILSIIEHDGQKWCLLASFPSWDQRSKDTDVNNPYRHVWINIHGYLVKKVDFGVAVRSIDQRNFFGEWMPKGASWLYGFAGEYPWASPYNTEPDEWYGESVSKSELPVVFQPSWNTLSIDWEYDSSLPRNHEMLVPARPFFSHLDLWWNGKDGYRLPDGRTIFRDPSVTESGPSSLLIDADEILTRLSKLNMCLVWTLLGEKGILGDPYNRESPMGTFSQIASLDEDGSLHVGKRVFFENYDKDTGPRRIRTSSMRKEVKVPTSRTRRRS